MASPTKEIGAPGLEEFSGIVRQDFLRELQGKQGYKRYNEMRLNSPIIGALMRAIEMSVRGISWMFESDEGEEDPRIEFLEASRANLSHSWNDHIIEVLSMLWAGYSLFEIVYERVGGQLLWRKLAPRGQDTVFRWMFDENGGLAGFEQQAPPKYNIVKIPMEKLLLYRTRVERNNPEGMSILRPAWKSYYFAKHIQQIEAIGIERDLAGLPMIKMPPGADPSEIDTDDSDWGRARRIVANVRNDEQAGVVVPPEWEFSLVSTGGSRQFDTDKIVTRYESRMLMAALAQFLMLGQENVGSLALSKDQTDFFTMSVNATADIIGETFSKFAVPRLMKLNGMDADGLKLAHTPAGDVDLVQVSDFLQKVGAKVTWTVEDEMWLRKTAGLPEGDPDSIQEARDDRRQIAQQIQARFEPDAEMSVSTYAAGTAPDDDDRRKAEGRWQRSLSEYLIGLRERVTRGARSIVRGGGDEMNTRQVMNLIREERREMIDLFRATQSNDRIEFKVDNMTHHQDVHVPEQKPPVVNIAPQRFDVHVPETKVELYQQPIPEQKAPVVNVNVEPTPIENKVNVESPDIHFPKKMKGKKNIKRDGRGMIESVTEETEFKE